MFKLPNAQPLFNRRYALEVRQQMPKLVQAVIISSALVLGMLISALILIAAGVSASDLFHEFVLYTLFDGQSLRAVLFQAAPLIVLGLAGALAFRARFWNLGLEGQMIWGAIAATAISLFEIGPPSLRLTIMFIASIIGGLVWALGPVLLKLHLKVNEIISTLMLNYIAVNFLLFLLYGSWKDPRDSFPYSPQFKSFECLPNIFDGVNLAIPIALVIALLVLWFTHISRAGLYLRFVDSSPKVAAAVGVPVRRVILLTVLFSGALAGLAGFMVSAGQEERLTQSFYVGYGFSGILIAFLARNRPIAATVVAVLVATLFVGGRSLQVYYQIPFSMVQLIQAILVICAASSDFFIRYRIRRIQGKA
jgi:general nucleoside transport system permease protein